MFHHHTATYRLQLERRTQERRRRGAAGQPVWRASWWLFCWADSKWNAMGGQCDGIYTANCYGGSGDWKVRYLFLLIFVIETLTTQGRNYRWTNTLMYLQKCVSANVSFVSFIVRKFCVCLVQARIAENSSCRCLLTLSVCNYSNLTCLADTP